MVEIHRSAKNRQFDGIRDFGDVRPYVVEAENPLEAGSRAGADLNEAGEVLQRTVEHHEIAREGHKRTKGHSAIHHAARAPEQDGAINKGENRRQEEPHANAHERQLQLVGKIFADALNEAPAFMILLGKTFHDLDASECLSQRACQSRLALLHIVRASMESAPIQVDHGKINRQARRAEESHFPIQEKHDRHRQGEGYQTV